MISQIKKEMERFATKETSKSMGRFFKSGQGEYAYGDILIGIPVPKNRKIAKQFYQQASLEEISLLLQSEIHEERLLALLMLVEKFTKAKTQAEQKEIKEFYLTPKNLTGVNNWDLVDTSCYKILGQYILKNPSESTTLYQMAASQNMWHRRIAIVSTMALIKKGQFEHALKISQQLLADKENLIQKATGWMLREVGEQSKETLLTFLGNHHQQMPKVTLGYATEKLSPEEKSPYRMRQYGKKERGSAKIATKR